MPDWMIDIPDEAPEEKPLQLKVYTFSAETLTFETTEVSNEEVQALREMREEIAMMIFYWDCILEEVPIDTDYRYNLMSALYNGDEEVELKLAREFPTLVQMWKEWEDSDTKEFYELYEVPQSLEAGDPEALHKYRQIFR